MSGLPTLAIPELWCVDLRAAAPALHAIEQRVPRLCPGDRARGSAFSDAAARHEWLATHIALRLLIERAAGPEWRGVSFTRSERGKPHLEAAPLAFSLSHTRGLALIGMARQGSIGVDIERSRTVHVGEERRARIEAAGAALAAPPLPAAEDARFLQAWVRLEAYAKADGGGIGRLLTRLGIFGTGKAVASQEAGTGDRAAVAAAFVGGEAPSVRDLQLGQDIYAAAVFAGAPPTSDVAWLPASAKGLEKLIS